MSSSEERKIAVPKYFIKTPDKPSGVGNIILMCLGGLGVILFFVTIATPNSNNTFPYGCCSGLFFILGLVGLVNFANQKSAYDKAFQKAEPKPSDEQMDSWRNSDINRIRKASLAKLDLELSTKQIMGDPNDPIMVVGPSAGANLELGQDNIIRFSSYDVVVVYLTEYHLAAYSCTLSMVNGLETKESTQEYHYTDVVSVATQTDNSRVFKLVVDGKDKPLANYQKFSLSVASGEKIEVVISFPQVDDLIKNGRLAPTGAENAVKQIRSRLREKKGGIQE